MPIIEEVTDANGDLWYLISYILKSTGEQESSYCRAEFVKIDQAFAKGTLNANEVSLRDFAGTEGTNILIQLNVGDQVEIFYETITNNRLTDCLMGYKISGAFTYNVNTGKIATAYSPSVSIFYTEVNGVYSYSMEDVSTSAKITSDGYSVIATAKFYVRTTLGAPIIEDISLPFSERSGPYGDSTYPWSGI